MLSIILTMSLLSAAPQQDAEDRYYFVVGLYEKGLYEMVVDEAKEFLRRYPNHKRADLARYRLASALFEIGRKPESLPYFRQLVQIENFEFEAESYFRMGQAELDSGRLPEATQAFGRVLALKKEYLQLPATFLMGEALFRQSQFNEAETYYSEVVAKDPNGEYARDARYGLAWCAFRREDHEQSIVAIKDFLANHEDEALVAELNFLRGDAHFELAQYQEALRSYREVRSGPYADAALRGSGFAMAELQDSVQAAAFFGQLIEKFPESGFLVEAALQQGIHLVKAGRIDEARAALKSDILGESPEVLYWRARAESEGNQPQLALNLLERALQMQPPQEFQDRVNAFRGDLLFDLGRLDEAVRAYEGSGSDYALHAAAVAALNNERPTIAVQLSRNLLERYPESNYQFQALLTLGEGLLAQEDYQGAEQAFGQVYAAEAAATEQKSRALSRLAWCLFLKKDGVAAAENFAKLVQEFPNSEEAEEALYMEGRSFELAEAKDEAIRAWNLYLGRYSEGEYRAETMLRLSRLEGNNGTQRLEELLNSYGDSSLAEEALYDLAERLYRDGEVEMAMGRYRTLLERFPDGTYAHPARYGLAWAHFKRNEFLDAAGNLEEIAAASNVRHNLRESALELLIWCQQQAGRTDHVADAYRRFAEVCNSEQRLFEAAKTTTQALRAAGNLEAAQGIFDQLLGRVTDEAVTVGILVERTYISLDRQQVAEAEAILQTALSLAGANPAVLEASFFVGEAHFEAGHYDQAVGLYALAANSENSPVIDRAYYKQGFSHLRLENLAEAERCFIALTTDYSRSDLYGESLFLLGETRFRAQNYQGALEPLATLRSKLPAHEVMPKALFRLGTAYCKVEQWAAAESALADLLRRFPEFPNRLESQLWRGRALAAQKNRRAARSAFEGVINNDRGTLAAQARLELGHLHLDSEDVDQALSEFLKVAVLYAGESEVTEGLFMAGRCLELLGDRDRARGQYQEIVDKYPKSAFADQAREKLRELGS